MPLPHVSVYLAVSIDGYIAGPGNDLGWLDAYANADYGYDAFMATVDTLLMGRTTHDVLLGFGVAWPFVGKRVIVATGRPLAAKNGEETHNGPLRPLLERLYNENTRHIYLDGGATICRALAEGLVDEMRLFIKPITLGGGTRLFASGLPAPQAWRLVAATPYAATGAVCLHYRRATTGQ